MAMQLISLDIRREVLVENYCMYLITYVSSVSQLASCNVMPKPDAAQAMHRECKPRKPLSRLLPCIYPIPHHPPHPICSYSLAYARQLVFPSSLSIPLSSYESKTSAFAGVLLLITIRSSEDLVDAILSLNRASIEIAVFKGQGAH